MTSLIWNRPNIVILPYLSHLLTWIEVIWHYWADAKNRKYGLVYRLKPLCCGSKSLNQNWKHNKKKGFIETRVVHNSIGFHYRYDLLWLALFSTSKIIRLLIETQHFQLSQYFTLNGYNGFLHRHTIVFYPCWKS